MTPSPQPAGPDPAPHLGAQLLSEIMGKANRDKLQALVDAGADVNLRDGENMTPLIKALELERWDAAEVLLAAGAAVNDNIPGPGTTPLIVAAHFGHVMTIKTLIAAGANVEAANDKGETALIFAANGGHIDAARCLIDAGAELAQKNKEGKTALDLAQDRGHTLIAEMILDRQKAAHEKEARFAARLAQGLPPERHLQQPPRLVLRQKGP